MKLIAFTVCTALIATPVAAIPPSIDSAEKLLEVLQTRSQLDGKLAALDEMNRRSFTARFGQGKSPTADQQRSVEVAVATASQVMREELDWAKVKPGLLRIIQETFDQDELDGILSFYATPAGQAFLKKFPLIEQRSAQYMIEMAKPAMQKVQAAIERKLEEEKLPK